MQTGHVLLRSDGVLLSVDRGFGAIMQAEPMALVGRTVRDMTAPADRDECACAIASLLATRLPFEISKRFVRDDGSLIWVTNAVSLMENGRDPELMVATVSALRTAEEPPRAPALLLDVARLMVQLRHERAVLFDCALFTDRAWDVMMAAYLAEAEGRSLHLATLTADLRMSAAQAERWIAALLGGRLIEVETRLADPLAPKGFRLTADAQQRLEDFLSRASQMQAGASPG